MYILKKYFTINCAHHLKDSKSLTTKICVKNHGHCYRIKVLIERDELIDGMVIDFGKLKNIVNKLDHQNLNNFIENPTAENIAKYLYEKIKEELFKDKFPFKLGITIWETQDSSIEYNERTIL